MRWAGYVHSAWLRPCRSFAMSRSRISRKSCRRRVRPTARSESRPRAWPNWSKQNGWMSASVRKKRQGNNQRGSIMRHEWIGIFAALTLLNGVPALAADYFPPKGDGWTTHTPAQEKLDPAKLKQAVEFAVASERIYPPELAKVADIRDLRTAVPLEYAKEPFNTPIGPLKPHAPANGMILRHGYIVAEW